MINIFKIRKNSKYDDNRKKYKDNKIKEKLGLNSTDNLYEINSFDKDDKGEDEWISIVNEEKYEDNINKKKKKIIVIYI